MFIVFIFYFRWEEGNMMARCWEEDEEVKERKNRESKWERKSNKSKSVRQEK